MKTYDANNIFFHIVY